MGRQAKLRTSTPPHGTVTVSGDAPGCDGPCAVVASDEASGSADRKGTDRSPGVPGQGKLCAVAEGRKLRPTVEGAAAGQRKLLAAVRVAKRTGWRKWPSAAQYYGDLIVVVVCRAAYRLHRGAEIQVGDVDMQITIGEDLKVV